jgi:hypothetical protein
MVCSSVVSQIFYASQSHIPIHPLGQGLTSVVGMLGFIQNFLIVTKGLLTREESCWWSYIQSYMAAKWYVPT